MTRLKTLKNISTGTAAAVLLTVVGSTASVGAIQNSQHSMNTASSSSMHMQDSSMQMHMQDQN
ncbi:MAG TPA: hypothetical protein VK983_05090, partial [Candidatus Limnocylindrales bacterium]|nr:hypothetical protein [Candidatus Limnocylindrales bacterium]